VICEPPIKRGLRRGQSGTGTHAGWLRHRRAGEPPCDACRQAVNAYNREWATRNPGRKAIYSRAWYEKDRDNHSRRAREWKRANPDKVAEQNRRWRVENAAWERERGRIWRAQNPDKVAEAARRRRARQRVALQVPFSAEQLRARMAFWGDRCWMCAGDADTVDHVIPLSLGGPHCLSNLRPACRSCNSSKGAKPLAQVG
jgi:5-methylcytosine-specific restriction endonuclease McrA